MLESTTTEQWHNGMRHNVKTQKENNTSAMILWTFVGHRVQISENAIQGVDQNSANAHIISCVI